MKKIFFLLATLLMSMLPACAVNWQAVDTNIPNFNLYIDVDSIKGISDQEFLYAIKYNVDGKPEKVAFIKSDLSDNYIGVIEAGDFEEENYRPAAVFATPHVFMKLIDDDSFLTFTHKYLASMSDNEFRANSSDIANDGSIPVLSNGDQSGQESNTKNVSYKSSGQNIAPVKMQEYVSSVCSILKQNWNPPKSGRNSQAIVIITIGEDGGLYEYHFAQSSKDEATDRSIISAIKRTVPYPSLQNVSKNSKTYNFQFLFDYKLFRKSVI